MSLGIDNNTILYLKGDTFEDSSLYKNSILNNGVTINNSGKFGSCYDFTQNSTSLSTSGGVRLPQNTFTIDWWEKNITNLADKTTSFINNLPLDTSTSTYSFIIGKSVSHDNPRIWISSNNSSWDVAQTIDIGNPCLNEWVHRAVINDGTNIKCYENGKLFTTIALGGKSIYPLDSEICFNSLRSGANPYYAYIDEIRISNTVRWYTDFTPPINQYSFIEELEENATLFDVVERIELLNELKQEEKNILKNNLIEKGVECSDNDKMSTLINKINKLPLVEVMSGDKCVIEEIEGDTDSTTSSNYQLVRSYSPIKLGGSYRVVIVYYAASTSTICGGKVEVIRNGKIINSKEGTATNSRSPVLYLDIDNVKKGDKLNIYYNRAGTLGSCYTRSHKITCDIKVGGVIL